MRFGQVGGTDSLRHDDDFHQIGLGGGVIAQPNARPTQVAETKDFSDPVANLTGNAQGFLIKRDGRLVIPLKPITFGQVIEHRGHPIPVTQPAV